MLQTLIKIHLYTTKKRNIEKYKKWDEQVCYVLISALKAVDTIGNYSK